MNRDTVENYSQIIEQIFQSTDEQISDIFEDIVKNITRYSFGELACYLRGCYTRAERIPNYHLLRNAAIDYCKDQNSDLMVFRGLIDYVPWKRMF